MATEGVVRVVQCANCHATLGDDFDANRELIETYETAFEHTFVLVNFAYQVERSGVHVDAHGFAAGCTFLDLMCSKCGAGVGRRYVATTAGMDGLRPFTCFERNRTIAHAFVCHRPSPATPSNVPAHRDELSFDDRLKAVTDLSKCEQVTSVLEHELFLVEKRLNLLLKSVGADEADHDELAAAAAAAIVCPILTCERPFASVGQLNRHLLKDHPFLLNPLAQP